MACLRSTFHAIETFQEGNRLKVDGVMAPGEETEAWLGRALKGEKRRISNVFGLGSYVGPGRANRPEDVRLTKRALALAGHYPTDLARKPSGEAGSLLARGFSGCPSSKSLGRMSLFRNGGSGSSRFDVKPLGVDGSSGGFGWSVF